MKYMLLLLIDYQAILIIILLTLYCTSYNLLEISMEYSLVNKVAFKQLPQVIRNLREVVDNYEYFSNRSIKMIVNMAVVVLDSAANVLLLNGEVIGLGQYIYKRSMKYGVSSASLYDFIFLIEISLDL